VDNDSPLANLRAEVLPAIRGGLSPAEAQQLDAILCHLNSRQLAYVSTRIRCATNQEAADQLGIALYTVSRWGDGVRDAVQLLRKATVAQSLALRREQLLALADKAIEGLDDSLSSTIPWLRFQASTSTLQMLGVNQVHQAEGEPVAITALAAWIRAARVPVALAMDDADEGECGRSRVPDVAAENDAGTVSGCG